MINSHPTGCLEPEVVAAYVDHGLSLTERAQVETHLASCRECTALLAGVVRTVADVSAFVADTGVTEATPFRTRRTALVTLGAAAAVFAVLVVPPFVGPWLERDAGLVSLVDSVGEQRSVLGRLTGGFPHAPLRVSSAGGQDGQAAETDRVLLTAGRIRESFGELATPSRLHALGVSQLLAGRHDDAVQSLLAASRERPANAQYLSDVAAVQLERARLGLRPDDLPRALAAADRARRLDPSLNEAWFNRALAMSALSMTDQARTAWTEYLKRDSMSPWATEARARLEELARPTPADAWASMAGGLEQSIDAASADAAVRAQTTEARNFIEQLLVEWADAVLAGDSGSAELERARLMAQAMLRVAGDATYVDAVNAIDRAGSSAAHRFAAAHKAYSDASALFKQDRFREATSPLTAARDQLTALNSSFSALADVELGAINYVEGRYAEADPALQSAFAGASARNYLYAAARATWFRGLIAFAQGRMADAQSAYEDTLATFDGMGDVEQSSAAHGLLSGLHDVLGNNVDEWQHRQRALAGLNASSSPRFRYSLLVSAAIAVRAENPETALVLLESVVAEARRSGRDAAIVDSLAQRAATLNALGRAADAQGAIDEAKAHLAKVQDQSFRRIFELPILSAESDLLRATSPRLAAAAAEKAISTAEARGDRVRLSQFQLRLAKANIAWGRLEEAERALVAGIRAFDERRANLTVENGISADDESWQLFDTALRLAIRRGDHDRAFAMAERARATSVTEQRRTTTIPSLAEVQRATRPDEAIVALNQFDDELAVWIIRHDKTTIVMRPIDRIDARRLVGRQQEEIRLEAVRTAAGSALYDAVVRPLSPHLQGVKRVVFVPDATYQDMSFAALWDRSKARFLVEDLQLSMAPSVSVINASAAERRGPQPAQRTLILAASAGEATANAVAEEYEASVVMTGSSATRARFLAAAPSSTIVHLAVPAYANAMYPLLSRLEFNDEPGQRYSGSMLGADIASREMPSTRIVVLDEIRRNQEYRTVGTFSLARAFLAAGVPAVLGTLPGADDSATHELMVGFHREMAAQASAEDALTRVQRNALQQNGHRLGAWTALVLYGSDR